MGMADTVAVGAVVAAGNPETSGGFGPLFSYRVGLRFRSIVETIFIRAKKAKMDHRILAPVRLSRGGTELHKNSFLSSGVPLRSEALPSHPDLVSEKGCDMVRVPRSGEQRQFGQAIRLMPSSTSSHGEEFMLPDYPKPPFPSQKQPMPGSTDAMQPRPDHGEKSYKGSGRLKGLKAVITGGDSGIGRAVAIAYAREGADVLIAFLNETDEANEVKKLVEKEGRKAVLIPGDLKDARHCREVIKRAVDELGGLDILVNNAAHQATFKDIGDISDDEWEMTFQTNIHAMFYLTKAAVPHMKPGSSIINTASVNADMPNPILLAYATTKGAIQNFTGGLAQMLAEKGIRANAVAPGPIWTPLIPSTMPDDTVKNFGKQVPMKRPGQPAELATAYVMLADPMSSYVSGTTVAVTGGKPFI
jgi:hypothetical protein